VVAGRVLRLSDAETAMVTLTEEDEEYFNRLDDNGIELTENQEAWYVKKRDQQGDGMGREYPSTVEEAFEASIEGAYFAKEMERVRREGRIRQLPLENLPVDTFWDLGVNDDMVLWFRQRIGPEHRFVGYYANSGEGLLHYARKLDEMARDRGWIYGTHHLPHDGKMRRLAHEAKTVEQMLVELNVKPIIVVPRIVNEKQGIEASRAYLPRCWFDEKYCAEGIRAIDNYRKEWDEERAVWKDRARHDWASHGYKAFETASVALEQLEDRGRAAGLRRRRPLGGNPRPRRQPRRASDDNEVTKIGQHVIRDVEIDERSRGKGSGEDGGDGDWLAATASGSTWRCRSGRRRISHGRTPPTSSSRS
jgi:hypothetical protein